VQNALDAIQKTSEPAPIRQCAVGIGEAFLQLVFPGLGHRGSGEKTTSKVARLSLLTLGGSIGIRWAESG